MCFLTEIGKVLNRYEKTQPLTLYKRNAGFIANLNISSRNKLLHKMKISSSKTRTTLILTVVGN